MPFYQKKSNGFITSKFRSDKIYELFYGKPHLWVEIINQSFENHIEIKKGQVLGFLVVEQENLKFHHVKRIIKKEGKEKEKEYIY